MTTNISGIEQLNNLHAAIYRTQRLPVWPKCHQAMNLEVLRDIRPDDKIPSLPVTSCQQQ